MDSTIIVAIVGFSGVLATGMAAYLSKTNRDANDLAIARHMSSCQNIAEIKESIQAIEENVSKLWMFLAREKRG